MNNQRIIKIYRLVLAILVLIFIVAGMFSFGFVYAQEPDPVDQTPTPNPSVTPVLTLTTAGWLETTAIPPVTDISALDLTPVDCALMSSPVVGYDISKGQDSNDINDFSDDLIANGFSVGSIDISGGNAPPACVDVLIIQGSTGLDSLATPYTAAEGLLLRTWAASGHGLMIAGEFAAFRPGTEELFLTYGYSQQGLIPVTDPTDSDPLGPSSNAWVIYQADNFVAHPILNGITGFELLASSWLAPTTNAIVSADADAVPPGAAVMAAFVDGMGCVALTTDSNWFSVMGTTDGYFKQDNATVAHQMVEWLNTCGTLRLTKSAVPNPVQAGQVLTYTMTATNNSGTPLTNALITDTIPASTTFVGATTPHTGPDVNRVITWSFGTLDPGASAVVIMAVQMDVAIPNGSFITNTAWVVSNEGLADTATALVTVFSFPIATVTGLVWQDVNGNGNIDTAEPMLPNITVVITNSQGLSQTLVTDVNGRYTTFFPAGDVVIDIDQTDPDLPIGSALTTANDPTTLTIPAGGSGGTDFGFQPPPTVTGLVWQDANGDGNIDPAEPGLPNITVVITDSQGISQMLATDVNGRYTTLVAAGLVTIDVDQADPDLPTASALTTGNDPAVVNITAGSPDGADFGFRQPPPPVPPATSTPTPRPASHDDSDPTATPVPAIAFVATPVATTEILPVMFLPETGSQDTPWLGWVWLVVGSLLMLIMVVAVLKFA